MQGDDKHAALAKASAQAQAEAAAKAGDKIHDLEPPARAGKLVARPMTLGIVRLCEAVGLDLEGSPSMADLAVLALMLCGPLGRAELVALAKQGRESLQESADAFAWGIEMADLQALTRSLESNAAPGGGGAEPASKS
jgi:hypothetical protein